VDKEKNAVIALHKHVFLFSTLLAKNFGTSVHFFAVVAEWDRGLGQA
jgi:hypothetical protein